MRIRLFGGSSCPICKIALSKLVCEKSRLKYEYIDACSDETQLLCDINKVEELPHLQMFDDNSQIIAEFIGMDVLFALKDICD